MHEIRMLRNEVIKMTNESKWREEFEAFKKEAESWPDYPGEYAFYKAACEKRQGEVETLRKSPVWVDPPHCPRCQRPLREEVSYHGHWKCDHHKNDGKCVWFNYELTMILRGALHAVEEENAKLRESLEVFQANPLLTRTDEDGISETHPATTVVGLQDIEIKSLRARVKELEEKYSDLIMQVETKIPDQSRHDTAKEYIRSVEQSRSMFGGSIPDCRLANGSTGDGCNL